MYTITGLLLNIAGNNSSRGCPTGYNIKAATNFQKE